MSTYICTKCGCIDNSACGGNYSIINMSEPFFADDFANKNLLCVECTPSVYIDGSVNARAGKWHNRFPKRHWSALGKEFILSECHKDIGNYVNAVEFFQKEESKQ